MRHIHVPNNSEFPMTAEAVIVGGGIVGAATAFFLSRAGVDTIVIERKEAPGSLTTAGSSEAFRRQFTLPEHIAMMRASIDMFENFSDLISVANYQIALHQPGYLLLTAAPDGEARWRARVEHQHHLGMHEVELFTTPDLQKAFPHVAPAAVAGTYSPGDGWLSVHEVTYGFVKGSCARFFTETAAIEIVVQEASIAGVRTNRGMIHADTLILAAGPFSAQIAQSIGIDLPLAIYQQQEAVIHHHPAIPQDAPVTLDLDTAAFWRPEAGGGGMVSSGEHHHVDTPLDPVPTEWTYPAFAMNAAARLSPFWNDVADTLTRDNVSVRAGQTTYSPDGKAIIGPWPHLDNLYLSVGHSGHGVMTSPEAGRLLAALVTGEQSDEDNPFSPQRLLDGRALTSEDLMFYHVEE